METSVAIAYPPTPPVDPWTLLQPFQRQPIQIPVEPFQRLQEKGFLDGLLVDRTTRGSIFWATDTYASLGAGFRKTDPIRPELIVGRYDEIMDIRRDSRLTRTRKHGEVFTPFSVCKLMCNYANKIIRGRDWKKYVLSTVLEITCGEAPFLVSRKNLGTGEEIPIKARVGLLDRKLKVIGQKTTRKKSWLAWAFKAFESTYGYEFQGDNLLMARMNLLATFEEYLWDRWKCKPTQEEYARLLNIISWNIWQMDGLTGTVPYGNPHHQSQYNLFGTKKTEKETPPCIIRDWEAGDVFTYLSMGA